MDDAEAPARIPVGAQDQAALLGGAGASLRGHRLHAGMSLAAVSSITGISVSTLSRLETGNRTPHLGHLAALASAYRVSLDDLVGARFSSDPRLRFDVVEKDGRTLIPLSPTVNGLAATKTIIHPPRGRVPEPVPHVHGDDHGAPAWEYEPEEMRRHRGFVWMLVLSGRLRLLLGTHDLVLEPGEAVEFDTRVAHWMGPVDAAAVETLTVHGEQGRRIRVRARPRER